ncbi:hypothetical protein LIER_05292 [Lithospermum erythrorhizon]|uniref:Uncharacterized protein n=1 Tax=Lithospermum erythrorhizon TaxID=34254 RepID=A0AAV3P0K2_LITER
MQKHYPKKNIVEEVVTTKNPFASLSVDKGDVQPELVESVNVGDSLHQNKNNDALLLSDPAEVDVDHPSNNDPWHTDEGDNHDGVNGSEVNQCGEVVGQSGDAKVKITGIDLVEINMSFHVDSAPSSPKDPERLDITCSESVALEKNQALG